MRLTSLQLLQELPQCAIEKHCLQTGCKTLGSSFMELYDFEVLLPQNSDDPLYDSTSARFYFSRLRISIFIFIKSFDFS